MSSSAQETRNKRLCEALKLELMGCKMPDMNEHPAQVLCKSNGCS